jgi:tetratricopeptide (TPR) repeat protein
LQIDYRNVPVDEGLRLARTYAERAIALDDTVAEAHSSLAWTTFIYGWDWATSQREFLRAIELNPGYATAHQWYAFWLASMGRIDEALVEVHTALEHDPASISIRRSVGFNYIYARRYDQVRHHLGRAMGMNPTQEENYRILGMGLSLQGHHTEAIQVLREGTALADESTYTGATLGWALARHGERDEALEILRRLEATAREGYVSPVSLATLHIGLGQIDEALTYAERAVHERRGWPVYFRVNPLVDPLRGHPRFEALISAMGLPPLPRS